MTDFRLRGYGRQFLPRGDRKETPGSQSCYTARSVDTPGPLPNSPIAAAVRPPSKRSGHCPQPPTFSSQCSPAHLPTRGPAPDPSLSWQAPERRCRPAVWDRRTSGTTSPSSPWGPASGRGYTGQRIGRSPGAQARESAWPIARGLAPCADGGGEKPARARTKAGSRAATGSWSAPGSGGVLGPVDRAPLTDFRREVSGGRLLSRDGPHLVPELPASLPQPGTASPDAGFGLTRAPCTCLEVLRVLSFRLAFAGIPAGRLLSPPPLPHSSTFQFLGVCTGLAAVLGCLPSAELHLPLTGAPHPHPGASPRASSGFIRPLLAPIWVPPTGCQGREVVASFPTPTPHNPGLGPSS